MVTEADGHQTFYYTLMNMYVTQIKLPSPRPRTVFLGKMRRIWDLDIDLNFQVLAHLIMSYTFLKRPFDPLESQFPHL